MTRTEKKEEILNKLYSLQLDLEEYLTIWKKTGGGTTGHAIGSVISAIKEKADFFKSNC
ncbi:hypothetical protein [Winogradskyella poriferorum]|uniref:hypothetical protein n=1 Tax=Winogradskyella poriferorum TaxID=307627 RepID=UPI003D64584D